MELMLPSLAMCIAGLLVGAFSLVSRRQQDLRRAMRMLAERLGLPLFESKSQLRIRGTLDGFEVEIESTESGFNEPREMASISVRGGGIPRSLTIGVTDAWAVLGRLFDRERIFSFDGIFDAEIAVQGDEVQATALLDQQTRRQILRTVRGRGASVFLGRVYLELGGTTVAADNAERFFSAVQEMLSLARALSIQGPSITERLEKNAADDQNLDVRGKNISVLLREFPDSPAAQRASKSALSDPSPWVRLFGAIHVGAAGAETLAAIARDEAAPEHLRTRAMLFLVREHARPISIAVLEDLLGSTSSSLRIQAALLLADLGHYPGERRRKLEEMIASADPHAVHAVARLFETPSFRAGAPDAGFEPILIELLRQESSIAQVAIEALARIGTVTSVEPLIAFSRRIFVDSNLKHAARAAIDAIQARIEGGERGRLSLAAGADHDGALSLDEDARGAVSIPKARHGDLLD